MPQTEQLRNQSLEVRVTLNLVLRRMHGGAKLHLALTRFGPKFRLTSGEELSPELAAKVRAQPHIKSADDCLPLGDPGCAQTWFYEVKP